jgi:hypothetical protein
MTVTTPAPGGTDRQAGDIARPAVGRPLDRIDGTAKTSGAARYAAEFPYPELAHAALVHSTVARAGSQASTALPRPVYRASSPSSPTTTRRSCDRHVARTSSGTSARASREPRSTI